jgi:cytidine deaminase
VTGAGRTDGPAIDWAALREAALEVAERAYVPYSHFHVGAAALIDDSRVITGCNVENASYGLTLCAECAVVSALHVSGGGRIIAVVSVGNGAPVMPCGRCRQLLWEHGGPDCLVDGDGTPRPLRELLPGAFDASQITSDA